METRRGTSRALQGLRQTMELWDPETARHSGRVARLVRDTLTELGCRGPESERIVRAAAVHDIGKLAVSSSVLAKRSKLTRIERRSVERHAVAGSEWLASHPWLHDIADEVRYHHERWDGAGYPDGLAGTEIPFGARVIAVADSFDAMTSDRPYRPAMPQWRAVAVLVAGRWQQWDGAIVDALVDVISGLPADDRETLLACA